MIELKDILIQKIRNILSMVEIEAEIQLIFNPPIQSLNDRVLNRCYLMVSYLEKLVWKNIQTLEKLA